MPSKKDSEPTFRFRGFQSPNYTMMPDELFDELMAVLSGAEFKVVSYIARRTLGFKKDSDNISLKQMVAGITTRHSVGSGGFCSSALSLPCSA